MYILLTEIPQLEKHGERSPRSPNHPETPDSFSTLLDNNKINTCTNLLPGSPSKSPTVNQHTPMLHAGPVLTKYLLQVPLVLDKSYHSTKGAPSFSFQHQCLTNTRTVSQQTCGPLELLISIVDCDQNFRSANLINCNQSDSTQFFFYLELFQCLLQSYIGTQCSFPR